MDAIVEECGGIPGMAIIRERRLTIYPSRNVAITGCVIRALQATGETDLPRVGNQRYDPPTKD